MAIWSHESKITWTGTFSIIGVFTELTNVLSVRLYTSTPSKRLVIAIIVWLGDRHDLPLCEVGVIKATYQ